MQMNKTLQYFLLFSLCNLELMLRRQNYLSSNAIVCSKWSSVVWQPPLHSSHRTTGSDYVNANANFRSETEFVLHVFGPCHFDACGSRVAIHGLEDKNVQFPSFPSSEFSRLPQASLFNKHQEGVLIHKNIILQTIRSLFVNKGYCLLTYYRIKSFDHHTL